MNWELGPDGMLHCNRHPQAPKWWPGRGHCHDCKTDPGSLELDLGDLADPIKPPKGCRSVQQLEAHVVKLASEVEDTARTLTTGKGKGRINKATAFRGYEVAAKLWQQAIALASTRERVEYTARLERLQRARDRRGRGGGGQN